MNATEPVKSLFGLTIVIDAATAPTVRLSVSLSPVEGPTDVESEVFATVTGADLRGIWEWAYLERVSTGLYMTELGIARGRDLLAAAERLVGPTPS